MLLAQALKEALDKATDGRAPMYVLATASDDSADCFFTAASPGNVPLAIPVARVEAL